MSESPIIFSGPMVRALLDGRKTMTRRLANRPVRGAGACRPSSWTKVKPGDRLWVRENWCPANSDNGPVLLTGADFGRRYLVDESYPVKYEKFPAGKGAWSAWASDVESGSTRGWRPSIYMPRWASRLTLVVTAVKVEKLQDIPLADVIAEGVEVRQFALFGADSIERQKIGALHFQSLWASLHGAESWDANPEVVALSFTVHKCNIDSLQVAA